MFFLSVCLLAACEAKLEQPGPGTGLGEIYLTAPAGSMSVSVELDGLWRVWAEEDWISLDVNGRDGYGAFTFSWSSNESDFSESRVTRLGHIVIQSIPDMRSDTLYIRQQGTPDGHDYVTRLSGGYIGIPDISQERVDAHLEETKQLWAEYREAYLATGGTEEEWEQRQMDVIIEYEIKSQTDTTVSFVVNLFQGSFNAYNELYFYNLDLAEDRDITLEDLLGENWVEICNTAIQKQIDASVDEDGFTYFFPPDQGGFTTVDEDTDFYIGEDGVPVVVFPQYAIAAGAAGAVEFRIEN